MSFHLTHSLSFCCFGEKWITLQKLKMKNPVLFTFVIEQPIKPLAELPQLVIDIGDDISGHSVGETAVSQLIVSLVVCVWAVHGRDTVLGSCMPMPMCLYGSLAATLPCEDCQRGDWCLYVNCKPTKLNWPTAHLETQTFVHSHKCIIVVIGVVMLGTLNKFPALPVLFGGSKVLMAVIPFPWEPPVEWHF